MKTCYVCGKGSDFLHLGRAICRRCFLKNVERRVKRHLGRGLFKKDEKILVIGEMELVLLKAAIKDLPVKITFRKMLPKDDKGYDHVIIGKSMDVVDSEFLDSLFKGKLVLREKHFNILEPLTEEEIAKYAELKKIKYVKKKTASLLDQLKGYDELKYNLYKNIKELRKVSKIKRFSGPPKS